MYWQPYHVAMCCVYLKVRSSFSVEFILYFYYFFLFWRFPGIVDFQQRNISRLSCQGWGKEPLLKGKAQYTWPPHNIDCIVKKTNKKYSFSSRSSWSKLFSTRRSTVQILPLRLGFPGWGCNSTLSLVREPEIIWKTMRDKQSKQSWLERLAVVNLMELSHFVKLSFCRMDILSPRHFINFLF
jgi:hypothetical protein